MSNVENIGRMLALDPGASTGAALFEQGRLKGAWTVHGELESAVSRLCPACRHGIPCPHTATRPAQIIASLLILVPEPRQLDVAIIERPVWWRTSPENAPALMDLASTAGALAGALLALGTPLVMWVEPATWKGHLPKDQHQPSILAALRDQERYLVPRGAKYYRSDVVDAAGLGLWLLRRLNHWYVPPQTFADQVEPAPVRGRSKAKRSKQVQQGLPLAHGAERKEPK